MSQQEEHVLDISWDAIVKVFVAIFILYFVFLVKDIALWFFFGLAISVLLEPAVKLLKRFYIPKFISVLLVYFSIFGILGLLIYLTAPIFIYELKQFAQHIPEYLEKADPLLKQIGVDAEEGFNNLTKTLTAGLQESSKSILSALVTFLGGVSAAAFIMTISFFLSLEDNGPERFIKLITPKKYERQITYLFEKSQKKVAGWFGARVLACLFVGAASFIIFYLFGVKYAFLLALISGFLNFVPYIGPWSMALLLTLFIMVSTGSWLMVFYVLAAVIIIQQIENSILTPLLMKRLIDIPPVLVLVSLLIGSQVFGFLGTIFAVPVFGIIYEFVKEILEKRREEQ
jgi:predicted PurR-regulated permease PerM